MLSLDLTIADGLDGVKNAVEQSIEFIHEHKIKLNEFGFKLVLFEALNNSIIHGNKLQESLISSCSLKINEESLIISVTNEGKGFNWREAVKGSLQTEALEDKLIEGGRGFVLYKLYGYDFSFSDCGRVINLQKKFKAETK